MKYPEIHWLCRNQLSNNNPQIEKWRKQLQIAELKGQLINAINQENYLLAHELKCKIEHINKTSQ